jgi:predicted Holliday junction resolvase-like endonuclease
MKKALMIIAIIGIIVIAGSVLYYFVFYKPGLEKSQVNLQEQKLQQDIKQQTAEDQKKQENKIKCDECLKEAEDYLAKKKEQELTHEQAEFIWQIYQDKLADCYKRYGN